MPNPSDYETLISKQFFRQKPALPGATETLLSNAQNHLTASKLLRASGLITPSFTSAYEGLSQLFRTMFEYREVRPVDGCWTSATQVVCRDLGMNVAEQCFVSVLHDMRNPTWRNSSFPSASAEEAQKVTDLLEKYLPVAQRLMHQSFLTKVPEQRPPV
ncbi:hypothetical protein AB4Z32_17120 [Massilia sp. 2TAF26]|uniref:hypothetical protein n=1 Tax=Massilia sp. 2TAF26 TaxID=3233012 RepID=UPI003F95895B